MEEQAILAALERMAQMQNSIRSGMDICRDTGLVFLRVYYEQLPPSVARRLTELHAEDVAAIHHGGHGTGAAAPRREAGKRRSRRAGHAGGESLPRKARLRPTRGRRRRGNGGR